MEERVEHGKSEGPKLQLRQVLEEYVAATRHLGWSSAAVAPLGWEPVIAVYEEDGAIKHVKTRYDAVRKGWSSACLDGRSFYWTYDHRL